MNYDLALRWCNLLCGIAIQRKVSAYIHKSSSKILTFWYLFGDDYCVTSRTSRTLETNPAVVNGFWRNAPPATISPWRMNASWA